VGIIIQQRSAGLILLLALLYSFIALVAICTLELERRYAAEDEEDIEDLWDDVREIGGIICGIIGVEFCWCRG
jgi:hypothetical protein